MQEKVKINNQIRASELRVVDNDGGNLGVISLEKALAAAEARGLDLIEISPKAVPPVAKITDYGKYQYEQKRAARASKAKSHTTETKSVQVKIGTGEHDLALKAKRVSKFLSDGHRVRVELYLRGRAKYFDQKFLRERLERLLNLVTEEYKIAEPAQKGPKGLQLIIERGQRKNENEQIANKTSEDNKEQEDSG